MVPINLRVLNGANDFDIRDYDQKVLFFNFNNAHKPVRGNKFTANIWQVLSYRKINRKYE
jgi:hypothetical protein